MSVIIIGSGITGSGIAYNILSQQSPPSVLLLEARTACSGASGRNGGHTKGASYRAFLDNVKTMGEEEAAKIVRYQYACMKAVHAFARDYGIQCDSWEGDTADIFYDEDQWKSAHVAVKEIQRVLGDDDPSSAYQFWNSADARQKFLTPGAIGALSYEAGSLSAYKFVIGVLRLALEKGLNFQTETPALSINQHEKGWTVETPRGPIKAERVVLATNGYSAHLYPALQGVIVPLRGHVTAQRPGKTMPKDGLMTTYSFIYSDGYEYLVSRPPRSTQAGEIVIGGGLTVAAEKGLYEFGNTDDTTMDPAIVNYLKNTTSTYFGPNWGDVDPKIWTKTVWSGIMGYSADGFPFVGQVPGKDNLYIAAAFQGYGMVLCFLAAKALTEIMGGKDDKLDEWFPKAFRMNEGRVKHEFRGRLHTTAPQDLEIKMDV